MALLFAGFELDMGAAQSLLGMAKGNERHGQASARAVLALVHQNKSLRAMPDQPCFETPHDFFTPQQKCRGSRMQGKQADMAAELARLNKQCQELQHTFNTERRACTC